MRQRVRDRDGQHDPQRRAAHAWSRTSTPPTSQLQWIVDAYTLVFAGLLLTGGSLGDRYGRKGALVGGLVIFGLGSVLAALVRRLGQLIATRAVMGVGAALLMPATLSILTHVFPTPASGPGPSRSGPAFAGARRRPRTGGRRRACSQHFSWGSVFLINVPVVVVGAVAGVLPGADQPGRDRTPASTRSAPCCRSPAWSALVFGIIEAPDRGLDRPATLVGFAPPPCSSARSCVGAAHTDPMLDLSLFRNPRFSAANAALTLMFFAMFGQFFLLTQYLQFVQGYSPLEAGLRLLPWAVVMMVAEPDVGPHLERFGNRTTLTGGLVVIAVGVALMATFQTDSGYALHRGADVGAGGRHGHGHGPGHRRGHERACRARRPASGRP